MKKNIAVIFGGKSSENDISVITAVQAMKVVDKEKYEIIPIYISNNNEWFYGNDLKDISSFINFNEKLFSRVILEPSTRNLLIKKRKKFVQFKIIDFALICSHGMYGEDGCLQGILEMSDIPYSSPNQISSGICMDKILMKKIFQANGFLTPKFIWFNRFEYLENKNDIITKIEKEISYPLVVKPASLGSSIGISFCNTNEELKNALEIAVCYDSRIIIEKGLTNFREINCAVLGNSKTQELSLLEEPNLKNNILNFNDKYINKDDFKRKINVKLPKKIEEKIKQLSVEIFKEFICKGVIRIDFMYTEEDKNVYVNELNTVPGSLTFYLWKDRTYKELINKIIKYSIEEYEEKQKNEYSFKSTAILNFSNGCKSGKNTIIK